MQLSKFRECSDTETPHCLRPRARLHRRSKKRCVRSRFFSESVRVDDDDECAFPGHATHARFVNARHRALQNVSPPEASAKSAARPRESTKKCTCISELFQATCDACGTNRCTNTHTSEMQKWKVCTHGRQCETTVEI